MKQLDEHEMLIDYSEMAAFDFNSKEFQEVRNDYLECKNFISSFAWRCKEFFNKLRPTQNY